MKNKLETMSEIESDTFPETHAHPPRPRFVRKQSIVDVLGSDDLLGSIQTESLADGPTFSEIDRVVNATIANIKASPDSDQKLNREVDLIKFLIHKAKEILDDASHSPLLDKDTLTVLSCNVNTISIEELQALQRLFTSDKCFSCLKRMDYCYDINHDSVKCIFEETGQYPQIEAIINKYGHKHLKNYDLIDMLTVYRMYREKGLVN